MLVLIPIYLILFIVALAYIGAMILTENVAPWLLPLKTAIACTLIGGFGGTMYCLRAIYLNYCVQKSWDAKWNIWYFIRPIVSCGSGAVSYLFLNAGLLILESDKNSGSSELGFYALAFVAGLNVDKFIAKIEDLAKSIWGIEKSRSNDKTS